MTMAELTRACWLCWLMGAFLGANVGSVIGEVLTQRRWWMVLGHLLAAGLCFYAFCVERKRSGENIARFYEDQARRAAQ
jgi:hypothetical protein